MQPNELLAALEFRYATKAFDSSRIIPQETWNVIEKSLALTPSSFGLQPWKFLIIQTPKLREKLKAASWGQGQVTDASHIIVLAARTDLEKSDIDSWIERLSEIQGTPIDTLTAYAEMIGSFSSKMTSVEKQAWNTRQVYIALGQLMTSAAVLGIDTCPLEGISPSSYDEILGLTGTGYTTAVACALGYRSSEDKYATLPKARYPQEKVISYK